MGMQLAWNPINGRHAPLAAYNPDLDVMGLYKAMKGLGTDERRLNEILCTKTPAQMQVIVDAYQKKHGRSLDKHIESETSRDYEKTLRAIVAGPVLGDAIFLHNALSGLGTKESVVTELCIGRNPQDLRLMREMFQKHYGKNMDQMVLDDLSLKTKSGFAIALRGEQTDRGFVDPGMLHQDVETLGMNMSRFGAVDEEGVSAIIFCRSPVYLQALQNAYRQRHGASLTATVKKHFSFHLKDALLFALEGGKRDVLGYHRDAKMLEATMAGAGTKDNLLVMRVVRAHWNRQNLEGIKNEYQNKYRRRLADRVKGETSGHYRDALLAMIG